MITGIGHTAFYVTNLEAMLDFYTNRLGFAEMFRLNNDQGQLWIVYLRISDNAFLELFPNAAPAEARAARAAGYNHLCLEVTEIEATVESLRSRAVPIDTEVKFGRDGNKQAWIHDPEGNRIELMQMMPGSMQAEAIERLRRLRT